MSRLQKDGRHSILATVKHYIKTHHLVGGGRQILFCNRHCLALVVGCRVDLCIQVFEGCGVEFVLAIYLFGGEFCS